MNNRKGFTLVELLAVIVVIGLIIGITIYGVTNIFDTSKSKSIVLDESGILKSARIYSTEQSDSTWIEDNKNKYLCVTIEELQNKGFINKNASLGNLDKSNYIKFTKDKVTLVSDNGEIIKNADDICTGNVSKEKITKYPVLNEGTSSTDTLVIGYTDGTAESNITTTSCYYGTSTSSLNTEGTANNNKCTINGLENNSTYYVRVCQTTENGSIMCTDTESRTTKDFINTDITPNTSSVTITYNNENISGDAGHYFKSSINGTSTSEVYGCELNDNIFICDETTTTTVASDKWYKTDLDEIVINYNRTISGELTTRITDKSNNFKENTKSVNLYGIVTIEFKLTNSDEIIQATTTANDGTVYEWSTNEDGYITRKNTNNEYKVFEKKYVDDGSLYDLPNYNNSKYLYITRAGYSASSGNEWICLSGCTESEKTFDQRTDHSPNDFCDTSKENCTVVLGVNWKFSTYEVTYNANGGSNAPSSQTKYHGTDLTLSSTKPTRSSYTFKGWNTKSDGSGTGYSSGGTYKDNAAVTLYAQWYKDVNGFRCDSSGNIYYITNCTNGKCSYTKKNTSTTSGTILNSSLDNCTFTTIDGNRCYNNTVYYINKCTDDYCITKDNEVIDSSKIKSYKTYYIDATSGLNCRKGAGTSYNVVKTFSCNDTIKVCGGPTNNWYYVPNSSCYVSGDYISTTSSSKCSSCYNSSYPYCVSDNRVSSVSSCKAYGNFAGYAAGACYVKNTCTCPSNFTKTTACNDFSGEGSC